ncbi:MAG: hypothetical protein KFH87_13390 [Bacteroidetes bacterium]|nr:hypothetical protein [Bacteroidota bacterium]
MRAKKIGYIAAISGIDSNNFVAGGDNGKYGAAAVYRDGAWHVLTLPVLRIPLTGVHMVSPTERRG